jgi:succinate dehydrogenase / fumarate reductase membrane anchor subunit
MPTDANPPGKALRVDVLRSELGRARGLGSAHAGAKAWWAERLTAIALVPLTLWFIASAIRLEGATRAEMAAWLHAPVPLVLVLCLIVATFWHMELGLRAVIEDYVHDDVMRTTLLLAQRGLCIVSALFGIVAALHLGL